MRFKIMKRTNMFSAYTQGTGNGKNDSSNTP